MKEETLFLGSKQFGLRTLVALFPTAQISGVVTINDRGDQRSCFTEFESYCRKHRLELVVAENAKQVSEYIKKKRPVRCLVNGWYRMLTPGILQEVPNGFFGLHNSLLPKFRGGSPLVWSIINGESQVGSSLFQLNEGVDAGRVFHQWPLHLGPDDYIGDVLTRIENRVIEDLPRIWKNIEEGSVGGWEQQEAQATYCSPRTPEDGAIDWNEGATKIYNFIRAQSLPYPCAFSFLDGKKLPIVKASPFSYPYFGRPGQVTSLGKNGVLIACGQGTALQIHSVLIDEKFRNAEEVLTSLRMRLCPALR